jgi:hypothetical protein
VHDHPTRLGVFSLVLQGLVAWSALAQDAKPKDAQPGDAPANVQAQPAEAAPKKAVEPLPGPDPIPEVALGPTLKTTPIRRGLPGPNVTLVDASVLPRDKKGIWVLDFAFKPVRLITVETPKGRRQVHYLYYRVINRTGKARMFVPQFTLVTDSKQRVEDTSAMPWAIEAIKNREDPTTDLVNGPTAMGMVPPSGKKEGIDDAVFGVAIWDGVDPKADAFSIFVRGLSDGYQLVQPPGGAEAVRRDKTIRIDFSRPGDERHLNEREIHLMDPPYEWIYW